MVDGPAETELAHCLICGVAPSVPIGWRRSPRHAACVRCGLVYRSPRPSEDAMLRFYAAEFYEQVLDDWNGEAEVPAAPHGGMAWTARARAVSDWLAPELTRTSRVLEVGCGNGENLARLREVVGCEVVGLEPSAKMAAKGPAIYGVPVHQAGIGELGVAGPPFDAIVMSHVLEHLHDPRRSLALCHAALRPGGVILVEVPDVLGPNSSKRLATWLSSEHLYYFSVGTLEYLLAQASFVSTRRERGGFVRVLARSVPSPVSTARPRELPKVVAAFVRHELAYWPGLVARRVRARLGRRP